MKIGFWSADFRVHHGQAIMTARVAEHQPQIDWVQYVYRGTGPSLIETWVSITARLWADVVRGRIDTLYLVLSRSNGGFLRDLPALLTMLAGVRIITHTHGSDIVDLLQERWLSPVARQLVGRSQIIVPSRHLIEPLTKLTQARIQLCENFFPENVSSNFKASAEADSQTLRVYWNSNIICSKGFLDVVEGVRTLFEEGAQISLTSIGAPLGDSERTLREMTSSIAAYEKCEWFSYRVLLDRKEAIALMNSVDVVCLPSRYSSECQPLAIIEAMCCGRAIVVANTPALRAVVGDYPAYFVDPGAPQMIARALQEILEAKRSVPSYLASTYDAAAMRARQRFDVERFDKEMSAILTGFSSSKDP
jgi:glycosyltransferase involved in cell wall biosynthesis